MKLLKSSPIVSTIVFFNDCEVSPISNQYKSTTISIG
jgi:hypothetical protein